MIANNRVTKPRTCSACRIYGHTCNNCPNIVLFGLQDIIEGVKEEMYKRALRECPAYRRNTFMENIPIEMRNIILEIGESNVIAAANIDFNTFRIAYARKHKLFAVVVCKPDIVSGNCMVCLEDKSPNEWVEFECNHGYCIPCRKAMNNAPLSKKCPYCNQVITELRVTDINNIYVL